MLVLVTEKVYESESTDGSDNEKDVPRVVDEVKENQTPGKGRTPPKKKQLNKATKQASLTSFFKKS